MQRAESPARGANRLGQRLNPRRLHVPQEPQRQVELFAPRPADAAFRQHPAQLRLALPIFALTSSGTATAMKSRNCSVSAMSSNQPQMDPARQSRNQDEL